MDIQFTLSDLETVLAGVKNKSLPVRFDDTNYWPSGFSSWRGSYSNLALCYDGDYSGYAGSETGKLDTAKYLGYDYPQYEYIEARLEKESTAQDLLDLANRIDGKMFEGWKGGWFTMTGSTPIFIANCGETSGFEQYDYDVYLTYQGIVGVTEREDYIELNTGPVGW